MKTFSPRIIKNKGFTLLEVMFALALIGIALSVLLASQSQGLRLANEAKFNTTASFLAQGKMAEIESLDMNELSSDSGDFGDLYPDYYWELEVEETSLPMVVEFTENLKQVTLTVFWGEKRLYTYNLKLYKFVS